MESTTFLVMCFIATFPLATGLTCYTCSGTESACVNGDSSVSTATCSSGETRCMKTTGSALGVETTTRGCAAGSSTTCSTTTVLSVESTICYCDTDNCNGKTTLSPAIATCVVGLVFALFTLQYTS